MRGKLIVIEGTDCSGKETQSKILVEKLNNEGMETKRFSFPMYDTPTGKIVGGPYLGKSYICEGFFPETAPNVDPKVSALYYAADRLYNIPKIMELLDNGVNVVLDRYLYSNMAHQGGKISDTNSREMMYNWLYDLEVSFLGLPVPDVRIFISMPYEGSVILKKSRAEELDQNEASEEHLRCAFNAYHEVANKYDFKIIDCIKDLSREVSIDNIKTIDEISTEIYGYVTSTNKMLIK